MALRDRNRDSFDDYCHGSKANAFESTLVTTGTFDVVPGQTVKTSIDHIRQDPIEDPSVEGQKISRLSDGLKG